jgi:hypothetical protein
MSPKPERLRRASTEQLAALKLLVSNATIEDEMVKKIIFLLIDESDALTSAVRITMREGRIFKRREVRSVASAFERFLDPSGPVRLNDIIKATSPKMRLHQCLGHVTRNGNLDQYGCHADPLTKKAPKAALRYTFWLSANADPRLAHAIACDRARLDQIDIGTPGLLREYEETVRLC